jgi:hypothetical protein
MHPPIPEVAVSSRVIPFPVLGNVHDKCCAVSLPFSLHDAVAPWRRRHRRLIAATGQWALSRGVALPADHVALWAAAADELGYGSVDGMTGPWRASALPDLMANAADWCALAGCSVPAELAASLWHLYGFLADTGRLHPASDPLPELRAAIVVFRTYDRVRPSSSRPPEPTAA